MVTSLGARRYHDRHPWTRSSKSERHEIKGVNVLPLQEVSIPTIIIYSRIHNSDARHITDMLETILPTRYWMMNTLKFVKRIVETRSQRNKHLCLNKNNIRHRMDRINCRSHLIKMWGKEYIVLVKVIVSALLSLLTLSGSLCVYHFYKK